MRALTIIVAAPDPERLRGALTLAAAQAALGGRARLFLQLDAVALLRAPIAAPRDAGHKAAGLPSLEDLLAEALSLGVVLSACQSGMSLAGLSLADLPPGTEVTGPIALLQAQTEADRLIFA
ncbi:DsrE family protein [uncultured Sphingobium sp.]|uniref:DsrE family protein n=1 Tax=uncultured Sphingobium sp. TaxID=316087 RepID=UPI00261190A0|nr:DsrE family protein [uncultured Sphingobium sp.]